MTTVEEASPRPTARLPLALKLTYTAFMAVLVPVYLHEYGPTNFLYICDAALILTLIGLWTESALPLSMGAVGIVAPQAVWVVDFAVNLAGGHFLGVADYMFDPQFPLFLRALSLFHGWLPFLLLFLVWKTGYDRRALAAWTVLLWTLLLVCFFFMPPSNPNPGLTPVNINYVWGFNDHAAQTWMPPGVWLAAMMIGVPLLLCVPIHVLLLRLMPKAR